MKCVDVVPVGRVGLGVGVVKDGVDPVLVYCDEVEPVGNVVFGMVVFVVDPVDVEKFGVEPVFVYFDDVEPVGRVGVGVGVVKVGVDPVFVYCDDVEPDVRVGVCLEYVVVVVVIEGFNVVRVVVVCCGEVIGVEEAVVEVESKSGLSQQVYFTSIRFLIKFWHAKLGDVVISSVIFQFVSPFTICWPFTAVASLSVKLSSSQKSAGQAILPAQQTPS